MRIFSLVGLVLIALFVGACSDATSPDNTGGESKDFAIVSVDQDSVYWGEEVTVLLKNVRTDSFTLFIHTISIPVDSVWRDSSGNGGIRFRVPANTSAGRGQIRIFEQVNNQGNTPGIQAAGHHSLVILPRMRSAMKPRVTDFALRTAYSGDLIIIHGFDIPMRGRDIAVTVGDKSLPVVGWDSVCIFARMTDEAQTGDLCVRLFDSTKNLGQLTKLGHSGELMEEGRLSRAVLSVLRLNGVLTQVSADSGEIISQNFEDVISNEQEFTYDALQPIPSEDSIIYVAEKNQGGRAEKFELRLKPEPESRSSGVVRLSYAEFGFSGSVEMKIKGVRWRKIDGEYSLITFSSDLPGQLIEYVQTYRPAGAIQLIRTYVTGESLSEMTIRLTP